MSLNEDCRPSWAATSCTKTEDIGSIYLLKGIQDLCLLPGISMYLYFWSTIDLFGNPYCNFLAHCLRYLNYYNSTNIL